MKEIIKSYDSPVILLGGGDINWSLLQEYVDRGHPVVAADGGANALEGTDIAPDLILGDLDSLVEKSTWAKSTNLHQIDEQDTTDFEKCLYALSAPYFVGFGFLGKRFDHSLAALHVLAKYCQQKNVMLIDQADALIVTCGQVEMDLPLGSRVSVFPLAEVRFKRSEGLEYALDGQVLSPGKMIGTSNISNRETITIEPEVGNNSPYVLITDVVHHQAVGRAIISES